MKYLKILFLVCVSAVVLPLSVQASTRKNTSYYIDLTKMVKKYGVSAMDFYGEDHRDEEILKISSNKSSVIKAKIIDWEPILLPKKQGKATVTVKFSQSGTVKTTVMVQNYKNPLNTLTIGKTSLVKKFDKDNNYMVTDNPKIKGNLKVKAASGWELVNVKKYVMSKDKWKTVKKSGSIYKLKQGEQVRITLKDRKTKFVRRITLY